RRDLEMLAAQAGGVHGRHVIRPAFTLGLLLSGVIVVLYYTVIPSAEFLACQAIMKHTEALLYAKLRSIGRASLSPSTNYARELRGEELIDPVIKRTDANQKHDLVMHARRGEFLLDTARRVLMLRLSEGGMQMTDATSNFELVTVNLPLPSGFGDYYPQ